MTPPFWSALATVGLALSTFVADEAFAFADDAAAQSRERDIVDRSNAGTEGPNAATDDRP